MPRKMLRAVTCVALTALLAASVSTSAATGAQGGAAPPFSLGLFSGKVLKLSDLKGTAVVLLFWTPW